MLSQFSFIPNVLNIFFAFNYDKVLHFIHVLFNLSLKFTY